MPLTCSSSTTHLINHRACYVIPSILDYECKRSLAAKCTWLVRTVLFIFGIGRKYMTQCMLAAFVDPTVYCTVTSVRVTLHTARGKCNKYHMNLFSCAMQSEVFVILPVCNHPSCLSVCFRKVELYQHAIDLSHQCLRLVQQRPCHVLPCLFENACERSLSICRKSRTSCPVSRLLSVPM